jgi:hypothetical protein
MMYAKVVSAKVDGLMDSRWVAKVGCRIACSVYLSLLIHRVMVKERYHGGWLQIIASLAGRWLWIPIAWNKPQ